MKGNICLFAQSSYGDTSLEDCLQIFTKKEILDGDEQPVSRLYWVYCDNRKILKYLLKTLKYYISYYADNMVS